MRAMFGDIRVRRSIQSIMLMLVLLVGLMAGSAPSVQAQAPGLFSDAGAGGVQPAVPSAGEMSVLRSRLVNVNLGLLLNSNGSARDTNAVGEISLNLFPDASYTGKVTQLDNYDADTHTWSGALVDVPGGYFYLTTSGDAFVAHVSSTRGTYEVSSTGESLYRVDQLDQSRLVDEPNDGRDIPVNPIPATPADPGQLADSAGRIDIMVLYTTAARIGQGSTSGMKARIALAVSETNTAYSKSGITPRLRLVHTEEVSYTESGDIVLDRDRLVNPVDGAMDNVHALRDTYGADMVSLIVENGGGFCGIAAAIMATASTAFDVVKRANCMTGYYSFGHEFGHLQGARHDMYVDNTLTPYAYGHGYVHTGSTAATRWRTVMAYDKKCNDLLYTCTRLQYFSNQNKYYNGAAMGTSTRARNYSVLNTTAYTVANFRTQVIGNNFKSNFNTSLSGWTAVAGPWSLASGAYLKSTGLVNNGSSGAHTGNYGDLTYTVKMKRTPTGDTLANRVIIRGNPGNLVSTNWWGPSYAFQYANNGTFSVYYMNSVGVSGPVVDWTTSGAIVKGGWNTLKVIAVGPRLKFYINGTLVWTGADSTLAVGRVGFGYYRGDTASTMLVDFANLSTTPTSADILPSIGSTPGASVPGGDMDHSP